MEWKVLGIGKVSILFSSYATAYPKWCRFLHRIRTETTDKIVLISNYTQTLDMFEKMLRSKK